MDFEGLFHALLFMIVAIVAWYGFSRGYEESKKEKENAEEKS